MAGSAFSRKSLLLAAVTAALLALSVAPAARAGAQQCSATIRDSKQGIVGCVQLHAGLVIAHVRSDGTQNFAAALQTQDPNAAQPLSQDPSAYKDSYSLYNVTGRVNGSVALILPADNTYYLWVSYASGPYQFTFEQPTPETVTPVNQTSFSGQAQQVTPVFHLQPGTMTVTVQSDSSALKLWLFEIDDLGGAPIPPAANPDAFAGELLDTTGGPPSNGSISVVIPDDAPYVFYVDPDGSGSLSWTVSIQ